ncbi:MAG: succinylglutamate desuccinylase/aspartoacylase family protein [Pseudomonadota bacterium]
MSDDIHAWLTEDGADWRSFDMGIDGQVLTVARCRRGAGPTVLVTGGTHGDEYEGQVAVAELARAAPSLEMAGTLICLPRHNVGACRAGTRENPKDGVDINRIYPATDGDTDAHAVARVVGRLVASVDWLIDLHSGGRSHEFVPSANLQARVGSEEDLSMRPVLRAFGAPWTIVFDEVEDASMPHTGTLEGFARACGVRCVSSELGGGGRVGVEALEVARNGLRGVLHHIGVLESGPPPRPTTFLRLDDVRHGVEAPAIGIVEPVAALGQAVREGEVVARIWPDDPAGAPVEAVARCDGVLAAIAASGRVDTQERLAFVCERIPEEN